MQGGLLSVHMGRKCPSCDAPLVQQMGEWALAQVVKDSTQTSPRLVHTGVLFTCLLYRCPQCKHLELVDSE